MIPIYVNYKKDLIYYWGYPFSKPEVGPVLGILDLICWIFCLRPFSVALSKSNNNNISRRKDPKQGAYTQVLILKSL